MHIRIGPGGHIRRSAQQSATMFDNHDPGGIGVLAARRTPNRTDDNPHHRGRAQPRGAVQEGNR